MLLSQCIHPSSHAACVGCSPLERRKISVTKTNCWVQPQPCTMPLGGGIRVLWLSAVHPASFHPAGRLGDVQQLVRSSRRRTVSPSFQLCNPVLEQIGF